MDDTRNPAALKELTLDELSGVAGGDLSRGNLVTVGNLGTQSIRTVENPVLRFLQVTLPKTFLLTHNWPFPNPPQP
jgi:hypothetical protein